MYTSAAMLPHPACGMSDVYTGPNPLVNGITFPHERYTHVVRCVVVFVVFFFVVFSFFVVFVVVDGGVVLSLSTCLRIKQDSYRACSEMSVNSNPAAK